MRLRIFTLVLLFVSVPFFSLFGQEVLSLDECLALAFRNQPSIRAAEQNVNAGLGRKMQAASAYFPQLSASTGYTRSWSEGGAFGRTRTTSYTTSLEARVLFYDFGKTGYSLDAASWAVRSADRELDSVRLDVALNVKQAYYALLAARNLAAVAGKKLEQTELHLRQAQAFFSAGTKPRFEVTRAEVDVNTARMQLITAQNSVRIQGMALNNAMGVEPGRAVEIRDALPPAAPVPRLDEAEAAALERRPELLKSAAEIEAARARVRAARAGYYPTLSGNGVYDWASGTTDAGAISGIPQVFPVDASWEVADSWNAGVVLSLPLFEGGLTRGRVAEATAALRAAEAQRESIRQSVLLEVSQSYADMESAAVRIEVMESSLQKARESLALAQGRYEAGVGPTLEVTDAQLAADQAETDYIQAQYDYRLSLARLFRAMGNVE